MKRRLGSAGLGYGQVVVLVFGFLIASGLIFLFGMWVGRDIAERRLAQEERVVRLPMPLHPTPSEETQGRDVDLAFYEKLKAKAQQMQETATAASPTAPKAVQPAPVTTPTVLRVAQAAPVATPTLTPVRVVVHKPTPTAAKKRAEPTPAPPAQASGDVWADAGWTVQVNATTNVQQALDVARRLKAKGYDAYTVLAPTRGQTWYRVRVGRFSDRERAKEMESRLKSSEGFENAYVTAQ